MSFVDDSGAMPGEWDDQTQRTRKSTDDLTLSANAFASAMTRAFAQATSGGKQLDDVLKSLALRLSSMAVRAALRPLTKDLAGGLNGVFGGVFGPGNTSGQGPAAFVSPFADGGVIRAPAYFPIAGGFGLAGEAGPEAIMPLARASDGSLGVVMSGTGAPANVTVQIATPDLSSFRRSEAYLTGQIARAVARGQRSL